MDHNYVDLSVRKQTENINREKPMKEQTDVVIISTTCDQEAKARELAEALVKEKLAACVHRYTVKSTYTWKNAIECADEYALAAKTRATLIDEVIAFIKKNHTYELPEIIVTPIIQGYQPYMDWIHQETK
jgi:periplasmic divalent cation tolerance protein